MTEVNGPHGVVRHEHDGVEDVVEAGDAAELLMQRGDRLRMLREMELRDNQERQQELEESSQEDLSTCVGSSSVLDYNAWLRSDQRYHDDLKHIDYKYIDFGPEHWAPNDRRPLIVEQDKSLGKGGFCWDAAYILGEYLSNQSLDAPTQGSSVIELGSGTGLCGMMLAKKRPEWHVTLTDLPSQMPLIARNLALNFAPEILDADSLNSGGIDRSLSEYVVCRYSDRNVFASDRQQSRIQAQVLEWSEEEDESSSGNRQTFDIIAGADVVASIYNPIALARTVHGLAHTKSTVYISFKERLTSIHREFEQQLSDLFEDVQIVSPSLHAFRNRNPQVQILVARTKKPMSCVDG